MPKQSEIRYRCVVCAGPVTMGHLAFLAMLNAGITDHLQGEDATGDGGDYIALVCAQCQENPEIGTTLAAIPWSPRSSQPFDQMEALEADRLGIPYP